MSSGSFSDLCDPFRARKNGLDHPRPSEGRDQFRPLKPNDVHRFSSIAGGQILFRTEPDAEGS